MRTILLTVFLCVIQNAFGASEAYRANWVSDKFGEVIIVPMKNAPFPHKSRERGWTHNGIFYPHIKHYTDSSVGILIPADYQKRDCVDLIVHFHGHLNNVPREIQRYHFLKQLSQSGKNAILILPQGPKNAVDSSCGKLDEPEGLKNLIEEVLDFLHAQHKTKIRQLGTLILSAHSGGYKPLANCLAHGGLEKYTKEVYLFDASYANLPSFSRWAARSGGRLISVCTKHLLEENMEIMRNLNKLGVQQFTVLFDEDVTPETLSRNCVTFIHSRLPHDDLMHRTKYFERFIHTSRLKEKNEK